MNFGPALLSSLYDLVNVPIVIVFALFVATLLNREIRGRGFFRAMFVLPILIGSGAVMSALQGNHSQVSVDMSAAASAASTAASSGMNFQDLILSERLMSLLGTTLSGYVGAIINRISSVMWISGVQIVIFLGVLQTIPTQLYEASVVDGASEFDKLWKITLPLTMPAILINVVYTVIDSFTSSGNAVIAYISQDSYKNYLLSYGSALRWIYFVIIGLLLAAVFAVLRRGMFYLG